MSRPETPVVTIGMPVYNNAATLARAIRSIQNQTVSGWRLIITDDQSSDGSVAIAQAEAQKDGRIEVRKNRSRLVYMNFGASLAKAESQWFVWLAADDFWAPDFLAATLETARKRPEAVSVLPRWQYKGVAEGRPPPRTDALDAKRTERVRRFLAAPGGTRMYGLTRTDALKRSFPKKNYVAYDWFLVLGLLRFGPQVEAPGPPRLFRQRTEIAAYAAAAETWHRGVFRYFPALRMSLSAVFRGRVPPTNLIDLFWLNMRKTEEFLAYRRPGLYARFLPIFRRWRLPISTYAGMAAEAIEAAIRDRPDMSGGAERALEKLSALGDRDAARLLGRAREAGHLSGDPHTAYVRAAELGDTQALLLLARSLERDEPSKATKYWAALIDAATERDDARRALTSASERGNLPAFLDDVIKARLRTESSP